MTERSLFNVALKLLGLWLMYRAVASFVWAFLASRYSEHFLMEPPEAFGWYSGFVALVFGLFLCCRSGWLTQLMFRIDGPLDAEADNAPPRRLMPNTGEDTLERHGRNLAAENTDEP